MKPALCHVCLWVVVTSFLCNAATIPDNRELQERLIVDTGEPCYVDSNDYRHGELTCNSTLVKVGDYCTLECHRGYMPKNGITTAQCTRRYHMSADLECVDAVCEQPTLSLHGSWDCTRHSGHTIKPGHTCRLTCNHGYCISTTSTTEEVTCGDYGNWTSVPECTDPFCHSPPTVQNGVYVCGTGSKATGDTCQLFCSKGHVVVGSDVITCSANQQWSSAGTCKEVQCPSPPALQDGRYVCPSSSYIHGITCDLTCDPGHRPVTLNINITCRKDETWSPATTCIEGCQQGTYVKIGPLGEKLCEACLPGTYQSKADRMSCDQCPSGWTTLNQGATSANECLSQCHPGTFSTNGLEPCHLCMSGSYQNSTGGQSCDLCPHGQTSPVGSASVAACIDV